MGQEIGKSRNFVEIFKILNTASVVAQLTSYDTSS